MRDLTINASADRAISACVISRSQALILRSGLRDLTISARADLAISACVISRSTLVLSVRSVLVILLPSPSFPTTTPPHPTPPRTTHPAFNVSPTSLPPEPLRLQAERCRRGAGWVGGRVAAGTADAKEDGRGHRCEFEGEVTSNLPPPSSLYLPTLLPTTPTPHHPPCLQRFSHLPPT